jgi:hypothetical protein
MRHRLKCWRSCPRLRLLVRDLFDFGESVGLVSGFLYRADHEAAGSVFLPAHLFHDLRQRGTVLPREHGDHLGPSRPRDGPTMPLGSGSFIPRDSVLASGDQLAYLRNYLSTWAVRIGKSPPIRRTNMTMVRRSSVNCSSVLLRYAN